MLCWAAPAMTWISPWKEMPSGLPGVLQIALEWRDFYPLDSERDTGRVIVTNTDGSRTIMDFASFRGADLETRPEGP